MRPGPIRPGDWWPSGHWGRKAEGFNEARADSPGRSGDCLGFRLVREKLQ